MKVAFLLDKNNSWIKEYIVDYTKDKKNFIISFKPDEINNYDFVFILGYTKVLNNSFLKRNGINLVVHESNLPKGKGFSPIQWQILEGKDKIVFTLFEASERIDSGDIFLQKEVLFKGHELLNEIRHIQAVNTIELINNFLEKYPNISKKKQQGEETFYPKRNQNDDRLDINKTIAEQFNHLRIANNEEFPLWFKINGHKYHIRISKSK